MEIYVDEKDRLEASAAANTFAQESVQNRAYINTLGAELALKYLASENVDISNIYNIHSIKKILEDVDIADIMLKNIHIDVRVIFDENAIFIPKSHFEYNLVPDIYLVFKYSKDYSEFLGFFEPKLINKNNANNDYYFIEKEKLNSPFDLKKFVENFNGNTAQKLSDDEISSCEEIIISMADNDISDRDKKYLFERLTKSAELREKFIEYENFETLSYKTMADSSITKKEIAVDDFSDLESFNLDETEEISDDIADDEITDNVEDNIEDLTEEVSDGDTEDIIEGDTEDLAVLADLPEEPAEDIADLGETLSNDNFEDISNATIENFDNIEEPDLMSLDAIESPLDDKSDDNIEELTSIEDLIEPSNQEITETPETIAIDSEEVLETPETIAIDSEEVLELPEEIAINTDLEPSDVQESLEPVKETISEALETEEPLEEVISEVKEATEPAIISETKEAEENVDDEIFENLDETAQSPFDEPANKENTESFGNNLLENLQAENIDHVSLETFDDTTQEEEVSTSDLLSEIDNVLNPENLNAEEHIENQPQETVIETVAETIDDIPDISDLTSDIIPQEETVSEQTDELDMDDLMEDDNTELEVLYDENHPQPELPQEEVQIPGAALYNTKQPLGNKKTLILTAAIIGVLAVGAFAMFNKNKGEDESYTPDTLSKNSMNEDVMNENVINQNAPSAPEQNIEIKQPVKELKNTAATTPQASQTPQAYMSVNRLVWDVPSSLSYSKGIQTYLRTAGKSIKLSLSADLLLATEFAYTNSVKVGLKLSNDGTVSEAKMISGSGSTQIDNIVLQSVKDTLNAVKPPSGTVNTPDFNLSLIIYF